MAEEFGMSCASILYVNPHTYPLEARVFRKMSDIEHDLVIWSKHLDIDDLFAPMRAELFHGANPDMSVKVLKIFYDLGVTTRRIEYYLLNTQGKGYLLNRESIHTLVSMGMKPISVLMFMAASMVRVYSGSKSRAIEAQVVALKKEGMSFEEMKDYFLREFFPKKDEDDIMPKFMMALGAIYAQA